MIPLRARTATDRAALLLQLVPYLINKEEIGIEQAAADFDVSAEQMREMVEGITVLGLPGDDQYQGMDNELFDIDWDLLENDDIIRITNTVGLERAPRLTAGEAAALLAGLQLARSLPGVGDTEIFDSLLLKLARGAASTPAEVLVIPGPITQVREIVAEALKQRAAVSFTYQTPDGPRTTRTVDPIKVIIANGQWYLQGWCHLRTAIRTFHLDRVSDLIITDIGAVHDVVPDPAITQGSASDVEDGSAPVAAGEESPLVSESERAQETAPDGLAVRIEFPHSVIPLLGAYLDHARVRQDSERYRAEIHVADEYSLRRLVARSGGAVRIVQPQSARRAAAAWAQAGIDQYALPPRKDSAR